MSTAHVNIVTLLSKAHFEKRRYAFSFDVTHKDNAHSVIEKMEAETQIYVEHDCTAGGGRSPEIELNLTNGKCKIRFIVSGALKHIAPLEKGEDVLEYNEAQGECRKLITLAPVYDESAGDIGFIKFKVNDEVKHTVYVHDVPVEKDLCQSTSSNRSDMPSANKSISRSSNRDSFGKATDEELLQASEMSNTRCMKGSPDVSQKVNTKMDNGSVGGSRRDGNLRPAGGSGVQLQSETEYDRIVCDQSLAALAGALEPSQANMLVIGLRVPSGIQAQNQANHPKDVVTATFHSLKYWKAKKTSREEVPGTCNQDLFEDLIWRLEDIGRRDICHVINDKLAANKKLEHDDFKSM